MAALIEVIKGWIKPSHSDESAETHVTDAGEDEGLKSVPNVEPTRPASIIHGTVAVQANKVIVRDPDSSGSFATIEVPRDERLTVLVDGRRIYGRSIVGSREEIVLEFHPQPGKRLLKFTVSEDRMSLMAKVIAEPAESYRLKDCLAARNVVLELETFETYEMPFAAEEISARIREAGYVGTLDEDGLQLISTTEGPVSAVILHGRPPTKGNPARYVRLDVESTSGEIPLVRRDTSGKVWDYETVAAGTPIGALDEGTPGIPGIDVKGNIIPAKQERKLPELGSGVTMIGHRLVASKNGRLVWTPGLIDVIPELVITQDLTPKHGPVEFDGDVLIRGSVLDGSYIWASGTVRVAGGVLSATVIAERGIEVVENVVSSTLIAGQSRLLYLKLYPLARDLYIHVQTFLQTYCEFVQRAVGLDDKSLPMVAKVLMDQRHPELEHKLQVLTEIGGSELPRMDARYDGLVKLIRTRWMGIAKTYILREDIEDLVLLLREFVDSVDKMRSANQANIRAASLTSSTVRTPGSVFITRAGIYTSSVEAENAIYVKGIVRGGFLNAGKRILVDELGTPFGVESSARVTNPEGVIRIGIRHPNTLLEVDGYRNRNLLTEHHMRYQKEAGHDTSPLSR